ncbi:unnamed protein product [Prunus brigantina]
METPDSSTSSDTNSRYYIHHGENPNQSLVTELLNGENYATWSRSVRMALSPKTNLASSMENSRFHCQPRSPTNMSCGSVVTI